MIIKRKMTMFMYPYTGKTKHTNYSKTHQTSQLTYNTTNSQPIQSLNFSLLDVRRRIR